MKKKININKKRVLTITIIVAVIALIIGVVVIINNNNSKNGVFSLIEKRWIEKNKSNVVDVSILNDVPIFGDNGEGLFFDFLNDFTSETEIEFNKIPYKSSGSSDTGYVFEMNNNELSKDELLFYVDSYVLISKDNVVVKKISDLKGVTIGTLEGDLNKIKSTFEDSEDIIYNTYNNMDGIVQALNGNDILYAIIPKSQYISDIFSNNYYIVHDVSELSTNYVLKVDGKDKTLNSIIKKFYIRWNKENLTKDYNQRLLTLYFDSKEVDDETIANFQNKEYVYGYVKNLPYESKINSEFIGYNSEILDSFAKSMNINFKIKEYSSVDELIKNLNKGKVDVAFNYYDFSNLVNDYDYSFSPYIEKVVVLTNINNVTTSIQSLKNLKNKKVVMVDNKLATYIEKNYGAKVKTYKNTRQLFNALDDDSIVVLDYNVYDNFRNLDLDNFKVIYEDRVKDLDFNFILLNINKNRAFNGLFKFYISSLQQDLYMARAKVELRKDSKKLDLTIVYILIGLVVLLIISLLYLRRRYIKNKLSKNDRLKYVDNLTSLKNRHYLNKNYEKWSENNIYPQSIIIIDVNKLGHINDVYGHAEGDMVLKKAANVLINNQLEQSDIVRTNGDQFLIYMVGYEENKVIAYMRKLNKEFKTLPYNFGATLGYSMILDDVKTIDDAINEAVLEVKTAKEAYKNSNEDK